MRLSKYDISMFAIRYRIKCLVKRSFMKLKEKAFRRSIAARKYTRLRLVKKCFKFIKSQAH